MPEGARARADYEATIANNILPLLRQTFGAQFTEKEGESLKTTLGDPNKSPSEKNAVLDAFIESKLNNITSTAAKTGNAEDVALASEAVKGFAPNTPVKSGARLDKEAMDNFGLTPAQLREYKKSKGL